VELMAGDKRDRETATQVAEGLLKQEEIVSEFFSDPAQLGVLRMREHPLFSPKMEVTAFIKVLKELFPKM
jgi:hypothetical protein